MGNGAPIGSRPRKSQGTNERLLRQGEPWRGDRYELKLNPIAAIQRVRLPPGKGAARQPKASLAWRAATRVVKRGQLVMKRRRKPRNRYSDDAFTVKHVGAVPEAPLRVRRNGSPGVVDRRRVSGWIAWEPGRSCARPRATTLEGECQHKSPQYRSLIQYRNESERRG